MLYTLNIIFYAHINSLYVVCVSVCVFNSLGRNCLFYLIDCSLLQKEAKPRTQGGKDEEMPISALPPGSLFIYLYYVAYAHLPWEVLPTEGLALSHQLVIKKMPHRYTHREN